MSIKEATNKGYKEAYEGDSVVLDFPNSSTRRGRVGDQVAQTLMTTCNQGVVVAGAVRGRYDEIGKINQQLEISDREYSNAITTVQKDSLVVIKNKKLSGKEPVKGQLHKVGYLKAHETSTEHQSNRFYDEEEISPTIDTMNGGNLQPKIINSNLTIRKLTPKECFRLMDFDDSDYQILVDNGFSDSQIYKFAGNSIVVRVLMYIFSELLGLDIL
ncbi:MAG: DNA cytosine methyltransferase [Ruminococcus sp.]|nr:DNA cytosine methyltransferase [Ruminococcus sp.]